MPGALVANTDRGRTTFYCSQSRKYSRSPRPPTERRCTMHRRLTANSTRTCSCDRRRELNRSTSGTRLEACRLNAGRAQPPSVLAGRHWSATVCPPLTRTEARQRRSGSRRRSPGPQVRRVQGATPALKLLLGPRAVLTYRGAAGCRIEAASYETPSRPFRASRASRAFRVFRGCICQRPS